MSVAVIGAGAIGSVLGSLLWRADEDVVLVGRAAHVAAIRAAGLNVRGVLGGFNAMPHAEQRLSRWPAKGSTWQSVARGQPTEIDYLNGEIVRTGKELQVPTPLNELVVALMQRVTSARRYLSARDIEHAFHEARASSLKVA